MISADGQYEMAGRIRCIVGVLQHGLCKMVGDSSSIHDGFICLKTGYPRAENQSANVAQIKGSPSIIQHGLCK
jgi:hypothetical protein